MSDQTIPAKNAISKRKKESKKKGFRKKEGALRDWDPNGAISKLPRFKLTFEFSRLARLGGDFGKLRKKHEI